MSGNFRNMGIHLFTALSISLFTLKAVADDKQTLNQLLNEFLAGAASNIEVHQRFWADDLIYTSSVGQRFGKAKIISGMQQSAEADKSREEKEKENNVKYWAEETQINQFGNTAIVTFRLMSEDKLAESSALSQYYNTGTFVKRNDKWQAVAWQATRIPASEDDAE